MVLLVGANLGSAGNLVETPWEIFTLFSCIKSSTQLKNLKSDIWSPYTGLSGLNLAFFLHCNSVSGSTAWGHRPGWAERFTGHPVGTSLCRPISRTCHPVKCVFLPPSHPRRPGRPGGANKMSEFIQHPSANKQSTNLNTCGSTNDTFLITPVFQKKDWTSYSRR